MNQHIIQIIGDGHSVCLTNILKEYKENEIFTDVMIIFPSDSDKEKHIFKAHSIVLAAGSLFFKSALHSCSLENEDYVILLPECDPRMFQHVLNYIYQGVLIAALTNDELNNFFSLLEHLQIRLPVKYFASKQQIRESLTIPEPCESNNENFAYPARNILEKSEKNAQRPRLDYRTKLKKDDVTLMQPIVGSLDWFSQFPEKAFSFRSCLPKCRTIEKNIFSQQNLGIYENQDFNEIFSVETNIVQDPIIQVCESRPHALKSVPQKIYFNKSREANPHHEVKEKNNFILDIGNRLRRGHVCSSSSPVAVDSSNVVKTDPEDAEKNHQDFARARRLLQRERVHQKRLQQRLYLMKVELNDCKIVARKILRHPALKYSQASALKEKKRKTAEKRKTNQGKKTTKNKPSNNSGEKILCEICSKLVMKKSYKGHLLVHNGLKNHLCELCGRAFFKSGQLVTHQRLQHPPAGQKPQPCETCGKTFTDHIGLARHAATHSSVKRFECGCCAKALASKSALCKHNRIHTGNQPVKCHLCPKTFAHRYNLLNHLSVHKKMKNYENFIVADGEGDNIFKCDFCPTVFVYFSGFLAHRKMHAASCQLVACSLCAKLSASESEFRAHAKSEHPEDFFECLLCGKIILTKGTFANHLSAHKRRDATLNEGEIRRFKCTICQKDFKTKQHLKRHMAVHSGERPFVCQHCGKSFATKANLVQHSRIHTGSQFVCKFCGKVLPSGAKLTKHEKTHTE